MLTKISIFFISLLIFLIPINSFPLRNWDEAWYAEIIKNMASGNYSLLVPFWNGEYYFDKGPLYFWLSLPIVKLFGIGEWQVRIVSVIASALCTMLVYQISNRLVNKTSALFSVLIFITLGQVYVRFSTGNLDALLVALFLACYYFWLLDGKRNILVSGIFLGLGFLVKGWALGLFPLYLIFLHSFFAERKLIPRGLLYIVIGAIGASGWWFVLGIREFGREFVDWYIKTPEANSFSKSFSIQPYLYYLRDLGFWLVVPFAVLFLYGRTIFKAPRNLMPAGVALATFLIAMSFALEKLDWHNLPVYPLAAIIKGHRLTLLQEKFGKKFLALLVLLLLAQIFVVYKIENIYPDRSKTGADLGVFAKSIIKSDDTVILDDHDFTSFLYYSDHKKVYVVQDEEIDPGEFWRLKYEDLDSFTSENKNVVLVTRDLQKFPNTETIAFYNGYYFVRP